jgi:hypothetical protein
MPTKGSSMAAPRTVPRQAAGPPAAPDPSTTQPSVATDPAVAPDVPVGSANLRSTFVALNPLHLARKIVPTRSTPVEHLAFYATIAVLAVAEVIEPPLAALIVVGHRLHSSHSELLREIGSGVDEVT